MYRVESDNYKNRVQEPIRKPDPPKPVKTPQENPFVFNSRTVEQNLQADTVRVSLNKRLDTPPANPATPALSPYEAVETINELPVPPLNDQAATQTHLRQRADIADAALANAVPPSRDDFSGLPPRLADMEYRDSLSSYNSSVQTLTDISAAANAGLAAPQTAILDDSAGRVWEAAENDPQAGAQVLAQEIETINATYGPEAGAQLINRLYQDSQDGSFDHDLNNILSFAGGDEANGAGLSETQRDTVGTAMGQAYDQMSPEDRTEFMNGLVAATEANGFRSFALGNDATRIADLISRSDSAALKTDAVNALTARMVEIEPKRFGNNGGIDIKALANSAAIIAGSGATGADQTAMFNTIIKSFPEMDGGQFASLMEDSALQDNLSRVFINNSEAIIKGLTNEAGGLRDVNSSDGLRQFFEMTMFSRNPGELREEVMGEAVRVISEFADPSAAPTTGRSKTDDARTAGSLIGLVQAAAINQKSAIEDDQESREETTQMFVGMAFAFVPGASDVLGEGSGKLLEFAYDQAVDYASSNAESGLGNLINDLSDGGSLENIDEGFQAIRDLRFQVSSTLENDDALYEAFNGGYAETGVDQLFENAFG